ncbi:heavy metal-associated domain-containing protein [Prosthecobacter sp.]|uniref:heavy metal-associated domain-containing protein n=1 Tax=Prosthecobacter sp. TaxID=1965333 RepID=UPI003782DBB9
MKHILTLAAILMALISCDAAEPATFLYQGEVAGVMCSACSSHVEAALAKMKGVRTVKVLPAAREGGVPRLEITATNAALTKEDAVKALGEYARTYDIRSLALVRQK